ncbi:MAG: hypothetical protein C0624_05780 [Desulfuromonas sp.]|nr:MAG: hypothetical protein C0624_05780 [Desulfuromonas sp.]
MRFVTRWLTIFCTLFFVACSLPPEKPITIDELMATKVFRVYKIEESPEDVLRVLNRDGEVIVAGERIIRGEKLPVYVKILATTKGMEVSDYER